MKADVKAFLSAVEKLSLFFLEHFKQMIPSNFIKQWETGVKNKLYTLKLCGSGGGGFLLGFTNNFEATKRELTGFNLQKLEV